VGLYLAIFAAEAVDDEIDGVEVGSYDDFHEFRSAVGERLENGEWGSRFPVLMTHSDSDGEWTPSQARELAAELEVIARELSRLSPVSFATTTWQSSVAQLVGLHPASLAETFIDVDGEPLIWRLQQLAATASKRELPISFQ
jgi:hypothetical protein